MKRHTAPAQASPYWFHAKSYGWGWGLPATWQGWVVLLTYLGLVFGGMGWIHPAVHTLAYLAYVALWTAVLILVCWRTGEPPRWRWGKG